MSNRVLLASFGNFDSSEYEDYDPQQDENYDQLADGIGPYEANVNRQLDQQEQEQSIFNLLRLPRRDYEDYLDLQ